MAEYTHTVVVCDRCYPDYWPSLAFFPVESIHGVFRGTAREAYDNGWEERNYGDLCPDCVILEREEDDGGEVIMGQAALMERISPDEDA